LKENWRKFNWNWIS